MRTQKKLITSLLAAVFVSGAFVGTANAIDLGGIYGDSNGDEPVFFTDSQRSVNSSQLRAPSRKGNRADAGVFADYADQAYGDLNGNTPVSVRRLQADNARALSARN
ncbi:MAG: hypothetical protein RIE06_13230 [Roseibium album]|uniref:Uncharacterized protein n=1 Tax=Roseibium album TaxID=311410 RepID=A0A0M7APQ9_9HYPH|nr:hypothetical protein [Roseibium album]MBG6148338.1 hypothetical protein [Labrenzia sp. EL_142]MBG6156675.1 hypothetical protein [Labrenzia sp. EL_162]MBG6163713.1 hypothetical protein [Labrenzia sp. EL_195]MBG6173302.1 hypothetical protein [Labrenzia sp. EL_132]MBG6195385.1 hypothetical protein [Labrenzia sp. EL_159]MBG6202430.1 hypothetical protein [Labrenzia sp. EL_13]MBG6208215.1 hypothetical protein [Labrenzia sp. EL_126]MBG6227928.1 hypothetical protein [Labrenzia sp. EL_208]MCR905